MLMMVNLPWMSDAPNVCVYVCGCFGVFVCVFIWFCIFVNQLSTHTLCFLFAVVDNSTDDTLVIEKVN